LIARPSWRGCGRETWGRSRRVLSRGGILAIPP
jgi:hypothetical protein